MPLNPLGGALTALTNAYWLARRSGLLETRWGQQLFASSYFFYKRYLEDPYDGLVREHPELFRGGNILDIGANIGYTSLVFGRAIDDPFKVYSFEPELFNFRLLERLSASVKAAGRIVPIRSAVGDQSGTIDLWENEHHHGDHRIMTKQFASQKESRTVVVPILTIDAFVEKQTPSFPLRFIKIDVQGYELPVCKGMERSLASNPGAIIALEYTPEAMRELGFDPNELLQWLRQKEYRAYTLQKNGTLHSGIADPSVKGGYVDLLFCRDELTL